VGRGLVGSVDTDTDCRRPGTGLRKVVGVPWIGAPRRGAARTNRRNRSPRGGHKDVALRRAVSDDLPAGLGQRASAASGQRPRAASDAGPAQREANGQGSWLVETCHARKICESDRAPRSSTPLAQTASTQTNPAQPGCAGINTGARRKRCHALVAVPWATGRVGSKGGRPRFHDGAKGPVSPDMTITPNVGPRSHHQFIQLARAVSCVVCVCSY
jgi:hypothetical protein